MRKIQCCLLVGALFVPGAVRAESRTAPKAATPVHVAASKVHKAEKHPAIHAAIRSLEKAQAELKAAAHDFGGHKADAMRSVDEAIKQLRLAEAYDNK